MSKFSKQTKLFVSKGHTYLVDGTLFFGTKLITFYGITANNICPETFEIEKHKLVYMKIVKIRQMMQEMLSLKELIVIGRDVEKLKAERREGNEG